jgi:hypothetical protein
MSYICYVLCIDYYEARQRKDRANSWNDCHSRVEVSRQQTQLVTQKKICWDWDFVHALLELAAWLQAGEDRAIAAGGQQSGLKKRLSSPNRTSDMEHAQSPVH